MELFEIIFTIFIVQFFSFVMGYSMTVMMRPNMQMTLDNENSEIFNPVLQIAKL